MAKKVPLVSIRVLRDGVVITPPLNIPFDFTKDEINDLDRMSSGSSIDLYRDPVNEVVAEEVTATAESVITNLLADESNLDANGNLKMAVLTPALAAAGLPKMTAAERDAVVAQLADL